MKQSSLERSLPKQAVCAIILSKTGILTVTRKNTALLSLPGGKVDEGETLTEALVREVYEETGISLYEKFFTPVLGKLVIGDDGNDYYTTCFFYTETITDSAPFDKPWTIEQGIECKIVNIRALLREGIFREYNTEALVTVDTLLARGY